MRRPRFWVALPSRLFEAEPRARLSLSNSLSDARGAELDLYIICDQMAFGYALRHAGVHAPVNAYDRLFKMLDSEKRANDRIRL